MIISPPKGLLKIDWKELWSFQDLWIMLMERDIRIRYKQTLLGALWAILQPVLMVGIFCLFLGEMLRPHLQGTHRVIFFYSGYLPWLLFASIVTNAAGSLVANTQLLTKVYFPRLLVPLSVLGFTMLDFIMASSVLALIMLATRTIPGLSCLFLLVAVLGILACATGVGVFLAGMTVKYRDFKFVVPFLVQLLFFATPVIYPTTIIPDQYQWIIRINPMAGLISGFRAGLLNQPITVYHFTSVAASIGILLFGIWFFRQVEDGFADIA